MTNDEKLKQIIEKRIERIAYAAFANVASTRINIMMKARELLIRGQFPEKCPICGSTHTVPTQEKYNDEINKASWERAKAEKGKYKAREDEIAIGGRHFYSI